MNDNDLKKCMRDISDDLVKEADLSVTGAASARTPNPNPRKNNILEIAAAAVLVAALSAVVIYKIVDKNRRSNEPSTTDIISTLTTPSPEAPTATERPSATELTTDEPTASPDESPTENPTETPTLGPVNTNPLFTAPPASKTYDFSSDNELAAALSLQNGVFYEKLREDNRDEYGEQYTRLLQMFSDGRLSYLEPRRSGESIWHSEDYSMYNGKRNAPIELNTNGQFNLPWIRFYCYSSRQNTGQLLTMDITFLDLIGETVAGKNVEGVISALDPTYPLPESFKRDSAGAEAAGFVSVKKKKINTLSKEKLEAIVYTEKNGSLRYVFLMNGCLVSVRARTERDPDDRGGSTRPIWSDPTMVEDMFLSYLSLEPFEIIESALPQKPETTIERGTDPSRITLDEARQLIRDAIVINKSVGSGGETFQWFRLGNSFNRFTSQFDLSVSDGVTYPGIYRQVFDGFDEAGVRELINKTFVPSVAAIYNSNDTFFNKYYVAEDGKTYFCRWYYAEEDGATYYDSSYDVEGLDTLVLNEKEGIGWMRIRGRNEGEAMVSVSFVWDGGQWKLASMRSPDLALTEFSSAFSMTEFSENNALRVIRTALADLYSWTHTNGSGLNRTSFFLVPDNGVPEYAYRGAKQYQLVRGALGDSKLWTGYASRYLTQPLVDRMLNGGQCVLISDGHVYWREGFSYFEESYSLSYLLFDQRGRLKIEIVNQSAAKAKVRLSGLYYKGRYTEKYRLLAGDQVKTEADFGDLEFEFELIDGVWKISGGNFFDLLDAVYNDPATEPYPTDADPSAVPPAPGFADKRTNGSCFIHNYLVTTYKEVHLKPGESMKIPVMWIYDDRVINAEGYSISVDFGSSDAVKFEFLDPDEAPACAVCFVASAISSGKAKVHIYGTYDIDKITNESVLSVLDWADQTLKGVLIDVELTVYVEK